MKLYCHIALLACMAFAANLAAETRTPLPAEFRHARVFVLPETLDGERIVFYTDTGGGWNAISESAVEKFGFATHEVVLDGKPGHVVNFPAFKDDTVIPEPEHMNGRLVVGDNSRFSADGFLGGRWFADRVWAFDYPAGTLALLSDWQPPSNAPAVALGFQVNAEGKRTSHFPRMTVEIGGEPLDMLLDTGATITLTENAAPHFDLEPGTAIGGSFITRSVFERWRERHPDWLVIEDGDGRGKHRFALIRVPEVAIAGQTAGPVWFAQRPDTAFHQYMAQWMDAPAEGAIGGSAFRYFRMVIDYPNAKAYFWRQETGD